MVKEIAAMLGRAGAVIRGDFTLASGKKSDYYIDVKSVLTDPGLLEYLAGKIAGTCSFDVVAGVAVGAVPIAVAVSLVSGKPFAIIRSSGKDHGKESMIIGDVKGKDVLLVEDVITSGGSVLFGIEQLRAGGAHADSVVTIVDRHAGGEAALREQGVSLIALTSVAEILEDSRI
ncbi:MAG: orotate phosphoribosyltransferase [Methanolinea sp. SDB]|nr:MAG: orotate phosphoribosyltransferase [Methanolinea sp. SDB]